MNRIASEHDGQHGAQGKPSLQGNVWGWKFSFYSLGFLLFMSAFAAIRYAMLPEDKRSFAPLTEEVAQDSLKEGN